MSGEIVPVAKAAASIAKKVLSDDAERDRLQEIAAGSPSMKAAGESYARRVAVKQAVLLKLYQPLARYLGVSRSYFDSAFHADMADKVAGIPDEHLRTPSPSVAIPAMQGLSYSVEEPDLKDMYLNLLATATDDRLEGFAHPSFAEIIKQLSPGEAETLLDVLRLDALPIVQLVRAHRDGGGKSVVARHLMQPSTDAARDAADSVPVWVDNWIRLGLIEVHYDRKLVAEGIYDWFETSPDYARWRDAPDRESYLLEPGYGMLSHTNFGQRFLTAVSFDGVEITDTAGS